MRSLSVFNHISLDGYFTDRNGDMRWAHEQSDDPEFAEFTRSNAKGEGVLVFGRVTYDLMAGFWPTPAAVQSMPEVARAMNSTQKVVFSRSLKEAAWSNTRVVSEDPAAAIRQLKAERGPDMVIMGSGAIIAQLARHRGLIDVYQIVINPIVLGGGRTMFDGLDAPMRMNLISSRTFRNGKVFATYRAA